MLFPQLLGCLGCPGRQHVAKSRPRVPGHSPRIASLVQITFLTNAKDSERLELLKEVGGTTLYDEKKAESLKTLASAGQ